MSAISTHKEGKLASLLIGDDLFKSCRKGSLTRVKYLIEKLDYDPNIRDDWDSTPLYYACLCGHRSVAQYLLENGARCEAETFDGERCFYGALTDDIRSLLKRAKVLNASKKHRDEFEDFTEKLLKCEEFSDIKITIQGKVFKLHKCIMRARSTYYKRKLDQSLDPNKKNDIIWPKHFEELVKFVYTGKFTCSSDEVPCMKALCRVFGVHHLEECLTKEISNATRYASSKTVFKVSTWVIGNDQAGKQLLAEDFKTILKPGLPLKYQRLIEKASISPDNVENIQENASDEDCSESDLTSLDDDQVRPRVRTLSGFDICFEVNGKKFFAHKLFVCTRSSYIESLVRSPLSEKRTLDDNNDSSLQIYKLADVSGEVFTAILNYIYTGRRNTLTGENVVDVMIAADYFVIPGLKKQCSEVIITWTKSSNVFKMLRLSKTYNLPKLEEYCFHVIAMYWGELRNHEDLKTIIKMYASEIKCRQETDSIEIIDEVRYHISMKKSQTQDVDMQQEIDARIAEELSQVDQLLYELGLEA